MKFLPFGLMFFGIICLSMGFASMGMPVWVDYVLLIISSLCFTIVTAMATAWVEGE